MHAPDENVQSADKWSSQVSQKLSSYNLRWAGSRLDSLDYWNFLLNELNDRNMSLRKIEAVLWLIRRSSKSAGCLCGATTKTGTQTIVYTATILMHNISIHLKDVNPVNFSNQLKLFLLSAQHSQNLFLFSSQKYVQKLTLQ